MVYGYDFEGYVTKYNILCSDGRTIMPGAFKNCDRMVVPLTDYCVFSTLDNALGHVLLENREDGVYGYGTFNDHQRAKIYQQAVEDELITGLGVYANQLKEYNKHVTYGVIRSVAICSCPANPQAKIDIVNKKSKNLDNIAESIIANGTPYEDRPDCITSFCGDM